MSSIAVAERAEFLVVAPDEGRAGADAAGGLNDRAIYAKTEFSHGPRFVDVGAGKEFGPELAKDFLRGGQDAAVILAAPGHVE
jgi:hypothetical protein